MATHHIGFKVLVHFDDGSVYELPVPSRIYYYEGQQEKYWVFWLEKFLKNHPEVTAKPIRIEEVHTVEECEEYSYTIGV